MVCEGKEKRCESAYGRAGVWQSEEEEVCDESAAGQGTGRLRLYASVAWLRVVCVRVLELRWRVCGWACSSVVSE